MIEKLRTQILVNAQANQFLLSIIKQNSTKGSYSKNYIQALLILKVQLAHMAKTGMIFGNIIANALTHCAIKNYDEETLNTEHLLALVLEVDQGFILFSQKATAKELEMIVELRGKTGSIERLLGIFVQHGKNHRTGLLEQLDIMKISYDKKLLTGKKNN